MRKSQARYDKVKQSEDYIEFLKKRLESENYKASVTAEEYKKTKAKYDKEKLILRMLKNT